MKLHYNLIAVFIIGLFSLQRVEADEATLKVTNENPNVCTITVFVPRGKAIYLGQHRDYTQNGVTTGTEARFLLLKIPREFPDVGVTYVITVTAKMENKSGILRATTNMSWEIHASAADVTGNGYSGGSGISTGNAKDDSPAPKAELLSDPQDIIMDNSLYVPVKTTIKSDDFELHVKVLLRVDSPEGLTLSTPLINGEKTKEMKQVRWNPQALSNK